MNDRPASADHVGLIMPDHDNFILPDRPVLDLNVFYKKFTFKSVNLFVTWYRPEGEAARPAIVLIRSDMSKTMLYNYGQCVIPLNTAFLWTDETGDKAHQMRSAMAFCETMGLEKTFDNAMKLINLIQDHIEYLLNCPPAPRVREAIVADATVQDEHGNKTTTEVRDQF